MVALQKATNQQTRRTNERYVLRTIYDGSPISRADVARATGLTRTTVSALVERLLARGLAEELGLGRSTGGKAPIMLRVPPDARHLIGIDVDVDRISGAVVNLQGEIKQRDFRVLSDGDGEVALDELDDLVTSLIEAAERPLLGIGVGTPGVIETSTGVVRRAVGLDWQDVPVGQRLTDLTGLRAVVINDSQAAAMAEWTFGRHDVSSAMIVVKVGEGIGAGIVLDGRLYQGDSSGAGEIGHTRVVQEGSACRCGSTGCLETIASSRGVVEQAASLAADRPESALSKAPVSHKSLLAAFEAGDELAREVVLASALPLGRTLGAMIGTLDIGDIVLIGLMTAFGEPWLDQVRAEARRSALPLLAEQSDIRIGHSGDEVVELGAAAMLMTSELGLALAA